MDIDCHNLLEKRCLSEIKQSLSFILAFSGLTFISFILFHSDYATSITKKRNAREMARLNMIIKLLQTPAYIVIFCPRIIFLATILRLRFLSIFLYRKTKLENFCRNLI